MNYIFVALILFSCTRFCDAQFLKVSENKKYIQREDGTPFFWLGDTAWELFHKLTREDARTYLKNRSDKGFTLIQAVVLAELDGLKVPNAYGEIPLINMDPTRPNEKYFQHVDFIVNEAEKLQLVIGMLPTWGDKVSPAHGGGPVVFNEENAAAFGEFLGSRYKNKPIVWILGGDRNVENENELKIWRAMAGGLKKGDGGRHLISYHPRGAESSHRKLHHESWLDFNMYQSGHAKRYSDVYRYAETLQKVEPVKPFVDAEPAYEDIAVEFWKYCDWSNPLRVPADVLNPDHTIRQNQFFDQGFFTDHDVRVHAYWNFLSGACGYTYGNNAIWQMFEKNGTVAIPALTDWREALDRPGASHMKYVKHILTLRPFYKLVPDQSIAGKSNLSDSLHITAAIADDKSFMLVYLAVGQPVNIDLSKMQNEVQGYWYDPRKGVMRSIGSFENKGMRNFVPPSNGTGHDWLLILDDRKMMKKIR